MIGNFPAISRLNFPQFETGVPCRKGSQMDQSRRDMRPYVLVNNTATILPFGVNWFVACALVCGAAEAQFSKLENYRDKRSGRVVRKSEMLLTAPDSVKIFIMFLLLQSLVCAWGVYPQARGMGVWWPPCLQLLGRSTAPARVSCSIA